MSLQIGRAAAACQYLEAALALREEMGDDTGVAALRGRLLELRDRA